MNAWVVLTDERRAGGLLAAARSMDARATGVVIGSSELAGKIAAAGFDDVIHFELDGDASPEAVASQVAAAAAQAEPRAVLVNDGAAGRMIAGAISGVLDAAVLSPAIAVHNEGDDIVVDVEVAGGKAVESVKVCGCVIAVFVGADEPLSEGDPTTVERHAVDVGFDRVVGIAQVGGSGLSSAQRVVGVGMGIAAKEDLAITDALCAALDAEVACTLPACDNMHWYTADRVLGSSHNSTAPELYIAVGISGSPNHTSGFRDAKVVVSINSDKDAEIFHCSDYGIVGDLYKVVPAITAALA